MSQTFDCIVIGVGAMGAAACFHLAARGSRVLGLEQHDVPHALGSSHGETRMIRLCYYEHPDYVPLLQRAYGLWDLLERETGRRLLFVTGGLYMGPQEGDLVAGSLRSARQHGLPHEVLDHATLARRFGQFRLPADHVALYEPRAGFLMSEAAIGAMVEAAMRRGAVIHGREPVRDWSVRGETVTVRTDRGRYQAGRLLICGGAWSGRLLRDLKAPLRVTRQVVAWVWPRRPEPFALGTLPVWAIDRPGGALHYGFPMVPGRPGCKVGHHAPGAPADPDALDRTITAADEETIRPALRELIPDADGPLLSMGVCMYTMTPDGHFIIDRHPHHKQVHFACGFSGHGFKFATVVGEALADLAREGRTSQPIGFLRLGRPMPAPPSA
jgi:sarcosine oxidase